MIINQAHSNVTQLEVMVSLFSPLNKKQTADKSVYQSPFMKPFTIKSYVYYS